MFLTLPFNLLLIVGNPCPDGTGIVHRKLSLSSSASKMYASCPDDEMSKMLPL